MDATSNSDLPDVCPYAATRRAGAKQAILMIHLTREEYTRPGGAPGNTERDRWSSAATAATANGREAHISGAIAGPYRKYLDGWSVYTVWWIASGCAVTQDLTTSDDVRHANGRP